LSWTAIELALLYLAACTSRMIGSTLAANRAVCALSAAPMRATARVGFGVPSFVLRVGCGQGRLGAF
jgi:hypothetical protein